MSTLSSQALHVRTPADLLESIDGWAASTGRSRSNAAVYLLRKGLEAEAATNTPSNPKTEAPARQERTRKDNVPSRPKAGW